MQTILVFTTSTNKARTEMLDGVHEFLHGTDWNVQTFDFDGKPFPVSNLIRFWSPAGCIVEGSGNGITTRSIPARDFGKTPVVYLGCDSALTPAHATCIIHDAQATADLAARELLMRTGIRQFAFVGLQGHAWSRRRHEAFVRALRLNGKSVVSTDLPSPVARNRKEADRLKHWLLALDKPCGLLAADDVIAATVLAIARISGISVPDELAVVGVDDNESICTRTEPSLTSVRPDFRQGGRFAARLLARKILKARNVPSETLFAISGLSRRGSTRITLRTDAEVAAALERIHAPGGAHLTPKDVLGTFTCSRRNAETRFRLATGRSVLEELLDVRMSLAKDLLVQTDLPVSAVVERCGYKSAARFIRVFRYSTGLTPLKWRHHSLTT